MAYTTIDKPTDYFNTKLYTGDGTSSNAITGVGFQPDFVWIKGRSVAKVHLLHDVVRGQSGGEYYYLRSDSTNAESVIGDGSGLLSLDTDGFTVGKVGNATWNDNAVTYASWNWLAGGTASSNTDGSITSSVSANTTAGFSIVSYTGNNTDNATVGHGLGAIPSMVITKSRSVASLTGWMTKHKNLTSNYNLILNGTDASWNPSSNGWVGDLNSSSVFTLKNGSTNGNNANQSGATYIAYCFAEKKGFSKFGSYTGNGSTDGTFIYTGFKPAFFLIKRTDLNYDWYIHDNKRNTFNVMDKELYPSSSNAENTAVTKDFLSNGVKIRGSQVSQNASGGTYIYMAFAENPLVGTNNIPATAR